MTILGFLSILLQIFVVLLLLLSSLLGATMNFALVYLMVAVLVSGGFRAYTLSKEKLINPSNEAYTNIHYRRAISGTICHIVLGICVYLGMVPAQFSAGDYNTNLITTVGMVICLLFSDWILPNKVDPSIILHKCVVVVVVLSQIILMFYPVSNSSGIILNSPFKDKWLVFNGGNSPMINHHFFFLSQKYALDLIKEEDALIKKAKKPSLDGYVSYGAEIIAPHDGEVVQISNDYDDLQIGETDRKNAFGNHIVLKLKDNVFLGLGHLKKGSLLVKVGDKVKVGQALAQCGNTGNTSQPHLHIQLMTKQDPFDKESTPLPMFFKDKEGKLKFYKRNDIF
ncbi:MAG: M23 family metallopeptidase [Candidatus Cloacimonetes bacterium]|nr:M23 family metallopeptidase [Candidatus Cloacimonadota bacterium]